MGGGLGGKPKAFKSEVYRRYFIEQHISTKRKEPRRQGPRVKDIGSEKFRPTCVGGDRRVGAREKRVGEERAGRGSPETAGTGRNS